jgi:adsorption protein B
MARALGPTSKADCLNWVYQRMLLFEAHHAEQFEIVMTHDVEDLIHPESLAKINTHSHRYEMIQIPCRCRRRFQASFTP